MPMAKIDAVTVVLRHNVSMKGDISLARRELDRLMAGRGRALRSCRALAATIGSADIAEIPLLSGAGAVGFAYRDVNVRDAQEVVRKSAFAQEIFMRAPETVADSLRSQIPALCQKAARSSNRELSVALAMNYVVESEGAFKDGPETDRLSRVARLLMSPYCDSVRLPASAKLRAAKKTNLSLSHDLHVFKAKFFPRMARGLLNLRPAGTGTVLDPFCGSGTALLEASLLGADNAGADIDPICGMISRAKIAPFLQRAQTAAALDQFEDALERGNGISPADFAFPAVLEAKIARMDGKNGTSHLREIREDSAKISAALRAAGGVDVAGGLLAALASDAATKKVRCRFVGIGNGRYAVDILNKPMIERLRQKIRRCRQLLDVFPELHSLSGVSFGKTSTRESDARALESWRPKEKAGVILTSPPYLPASSGREHYASARALSSAILGIRIKDDGANGIANEKFSLDACPESTKLLAYLDSGLGSETDVQRDAMRFKYKAPLTRQYIADIARFFSGARKIIARDGVLLMVVANRHTFYSHRRGEIEHVVKGRNFYSEIARTAGFDLAEEMEMELLKPVKTLARPMAKRDYYESVLVFRPAGRAATHP